MVEFPQTTSNLTEASTNLYELIKGANLITYADNEIRLAVNRTVAVEMSRGWRIAKEKASHKMDVVVALAQAALGAVKRDSSRLASITRFRRTHSGFSLMRRVGQNGCERTADPADYTEVVLKMMSARTSKMSSHVSLRDGNGTPSE